MSYRLIILLISFLCSVSLSAQTQAELLSQIDELVEHKEDCRKPRYDAIESLKAQLPDALKSKNHKLVAGIYKQLYDCYSHFQTDSALLCLDRLAVMPAIRDDADEMTAILIERAEMLAVMGAYTDALSVVGQLRADKMSTVNRNDYYHVCRTIFGWMKDYLAKTLVTSSDFDGKVALYRDSIIRYEIDDVSRYVVIADRYVAQNHCDSARHTLDMCKNRAEGIQLSYIYYIYSEIARIEGHDDEQINYLALTAIEDFKRGVTEYTALSALAHLLFLRGDVDRAYKYLFCSLEDATFCNARLRSIEVSEILPIIENSYEQKQHDQQRWQSIATYGISIVALFLVVGIFYLRRQMLKLSSTRRQLAKTNAKLADSNAQLEAINQQLESANIQLGTTNTNLQQANISLRQMDKVKEEYIAIYLSRCREYLEGLETFRKQLLKLAKSNNHSELLKKLKSDDLIEAEQERFYRDFDEAFLNIHPNFVENFNELLRPEDRITPKRKDSLTTELRIFALIRLGVDDTAEIAHFLSYSMPTIYNYRSRIKGKSVFDKDEFDRRLMEL